MVKGKPDFFLVIECLLNRKMGALMLSRLQ